MKFALDF